VAIDARFHRGRASRLENFLLVNLPVTGIAADSCFGVWTVSEEDVVFNGVNPLGGFDDFSRRPLQKVEECRSGGFGVTGSASGNRWESGALTALGFRVAVCAWQAKCGVFLMVEASVLAAGGGKKCPPGKRSDGQRKTKQLHRASSGSE
jgi:hypothetical protein